MKLQIKKTIAIILLVALLAFIVPAQSAKADIWGESLFAAMTFKELLEETYNKIQQTMLASLRAMAIRTIQGRLMALLGSGGKGGGGPISDWRQFIYGTATQYSTKMTSDFFRGLQSGVPGPLAQRIITPAQKAVLADPSAMKPDLQNYVREGRADQIFTKGYAQDPWAAWRRVSMPQNEVSSAFTRGLGIQAESLRQKEGEKAAEGVAGAGFQGKKDTSGGGTSGQEGKITTPGSTIKDLVTRVQTMGIDTISMSQAIPDIVAGMVTSMLTQMLNKGLVMATSQIDRQIMQVRNQVMSGAGNLTKNFVNPSQIQNMIQKGLK